MSETISEIRHNPVKKQIDTDDMCRAKCPYREQILERIMEIMRNKDYHHEDDIDVEMVRACVLQNWDTCVIKIRKVLINLDKE